MTTKPEVTTKTGHACERCEVDHPWRECPHLTERVAALEKEIGEPTEGSHPDEHKPRAETWLKERQNWQTEVEQLRKFVVAMEKEKQKLQDEVDEQASTILKLMVQNCALQNRSLGPRRQDGGEP